MRLEHLCDMELAAPAAQLPGSTGGGAIGAGMSGTASGAYLYGAVQWVPPPMEADEAQERADAEVLLTTQEGIQLRCVLHGYKVAGPSKPGGPDQILLVVRFAGGGARYQWLTRALCLAEEFHFPTAGRLQLRLYICVHELGHLGHLP
jgi:hypothetical protein